MERKPALENNVPQSTEWGSDIVSKSTPKKRRRVNLNPLDSKDEALIEQFEKCLETSLTEKAAKSNLSTGAVKSLIKYVVTDENFIALMKHKEKSEGAFEALPFEPKITRSRAKALSNSGASLFLPWEPTASNDSEVYELLAKDLHEESSDDEYIPGTEESEDDSFSCTPSNPPTPSTKKENSIDDEEFEEPQLEIVICEDDYLQSDEAPNIALRTRSKLSLSDTPLEKIEQSFVPPDIPNDLYELECNDEDWKNFLSSFAQPLDEVKNAEEEDLDPEYNILSDEEITKVDTEELRDDRAVRVPKKELNDLIAELFDYVDYYENKKDFQDDNLEINIDPESYPIQELELDRYIEIFDGNSNKQIDLNLEQVIPSSGREPSSDVCLEKSENENPLVGLFSKIQLQLLQQQMSQHVQMLLQNFILTFNHPCFSEYAYEFKEFLLNFKLLSGDNDSSVFNTINLKGALTFMENWEKKFEEKSEEAVETIKQFQEVMEKSLDCFMNKKHYYLPFPQSILKAVSESEVFLYPQLLPKIPFKHPDLTNYNYAAFSTSEYQLVALGLEQFVKFLNNDKEFSRGERGINMLKISEVIKKMLMPARKIFQIYRNICEMKHAKDWQNPITFYFKNKKAPATIHQLIDMNQFRILPPNQRPPNIVPRQWRAYIYQTPQEEEEDDEPQEKRSKPAPPALKEPSVLRKILPKGEIPAEKKVSKKSRSRSTQFNYYSKKRCENCFRRAIPYVEYSKLIKKPEFFEKFFPNCKFNPNSDPHNTTSPDILRSRPSLDRSDEQEGSTEKCEPISLVEQETGEPVLCDLDEEHTNKMPEKKEVRSTLENSKKDLSVVDEEKTKKGKEFSESIATLAPPNLETDKERRRVFSLSYMGKLEETLGPDTFGKIMKIFSNEKVSNAVELYMKMKPILLPKHQDLADEFLLFLTAEQAHAVAQLTPFFIMNHMAKFLRYLEQSSEERHAQLVYRSLQNLNNTPTANLEIIEKAILALLKSSPLLCDSFLRLFLEESALDTLLNGAWDVIEVNKELNRAKEEGAFKNLAVTDEDLACSCGHKIEADQLQKNQCNNCGLKFVQGMIYCQTSMGMKPINIIQILTVPVLRIDQNSNKLSSLENTQTNIELEDGRKMGVRLCNSNKKSTPKPKTTKQSPKGKKNMRRSASSEIINQSNVETQMETLPVTEANKSSSSPPKECPKNTQTNIELEDGRKRRVRLCRSNKNSTPKQKTTKESPKGKKNMRRSASSEIINQSNVETQMETLPVTEANKSSSSPPKESPENTQTNIELEDGRKRRVRLCRSNKNSTPKPKTTKQSPKGKKNMRRSASSEIINQSNVETQMETLPVTEANKSSSSPPKESPENTQTNIELEDGRKRGVRLCKSNKNSTPKPKTTKESPKGKKNMRRSASSEIINQSNVETQMETLPVTEANKSSSSPPKESPENTQTNIELEDGRKRRVRLCRSNKNSTPKPKTTKESPKGNKNMRRSASSEIINQSNVETQMETLPVTEANKSSSSPPKESPENTQTNIELEDGRKRRVRLCRSNKNSTPKPKTTKESPKGNKNMRRSASSEIIDQSNVETQMETLPVTEANKSSSSPPKEIPENTQTNIELEDGRKRRVRLCRSNKNSTPKPKTTKESPKGNKNMRRSASSEIINQSNVETQMETLPVTEANKSSSSPPKESPENTQTNIELEDGRKRGVRLCKSNKNSTPKPKTTKESPKGNKNMRRSASSEIIDQSNVETQMETLPVTEANKSSSSPPKESPENTQTNIELEDGRKRGVRLCKSNKNSTPKPKTTKESPKGNKNMRRSASSEIIDQSNVETQMETLPVTEANKSSSSPPKEIPENAHTNIDPEDGRIRRVRQCRSNNKSTPKRKTSEESPKGKENKRRKLASSKIITQSNGATSKEMIPVTEADWKNLPSSKYKSPSDSDSSQEVKAPLNAIDEEITVCKEEITITEETIKQKELMNEDLSNNWTKEEDRILLESFRQNIHEDPINLIKQRLKNRSEEEIRLRFDYLMKMLQEMYSGGDSRI